MNFAAPIYLWIALAAAPLLVWFFWWTWRTKQQLLTQFIRARLLSSLTVGLSRERQMVRMGLLVAAVASVLLALARPQWGFNWEEAKQSGLDIIVAIDTSQSMLATDTSPNRLERAKLEALTLMGKAKTDRLGLIAFAGTAFLQCPLTLDDEAFRQSVIALDTKIIPQGGTAVAEAIQTATAAFNDSADNFKVLILVTDGEDHEPGAIDAAKAAAEAGVRIFTVGVGTSDGELLRIRDSKGVEQFVKDESGNVVKSHLNETLLREIATLTKAFYLPLRGADTMDVLYERGLAPLPKNEVSAKLIKRRFERYYWPLALAILLLMIEMLLPERSKVKSASAASAASATANLPKVAALLAVLLLPLMASASISGAKSAYDKGQFDRALRQYEELLHENPKEPRLNYNAGTAAFQAGNLEQAAKNFEVALTAQDLKLQQLAFYNSGNTHYRLGADATELDDKKSKWEQALKMFEGAMQLDPKDADAKFNYDFVKKKLEELEQQQKQKEDSDKKKEPSEAAKKAKADADAEVLRRDYAKALGIMEAIAKVDETASYYSDYIQRLQEVNGVKKADHP